MLREGKAIRFFMFILFVTPIWMVSCRSSEPKLADEITFYGWGGENEIEGLFDGFEEEYGVKVIYQEYDSLIEAVDSVRNGNVYDVVSMENQYVPQMIEEGLLAELDKANIPNFKNISPNFRDLSYDPSNRYTIPYSFGTTGIVVRTDLAAREVTSWSDLWADDFAGKVAMWEGTPRYTVAAALMALGYSINSENREEVRKAVDILIDAKPNIYWLNEELSSAPVLVAGDVEIALGWSLDVWEAGESVRTVDYVIPKEGSILWGDNFVIPANSPNKYTAELFLDYVMRPEKAALITNWTYYPMANEASYPFVDPVILEDPVSFPTNEEVRNAELLLPLSQEGQKMFEAEWARFLAATP
jgi:spermidine/putrescine transport system substrate-binding protein